jgi:hypothetical protein
VSPVEDKFDVDAHEEPWSEADLSGAPSASSRAEKPIAGMTAVEMNTAAAIFVVLLAAFALTGLALSHLDQKRPSIADCSRLGEDTARLNCFDRLTQSVKQPFKGAAPTDIGEPYP